VLTLSAASAGMPSTIMNTALWRASFFCECWQAAVITDTIINRAIFFIASVIDYSMLTLYIPGIL